MSSRKNNLLVKGQVKYIFLKSLSPLGGTRDSDKEMISWKYTGASENNGHVW